MSTYLNVSQHAIDLPGGALLAPGGACELEDDGAELLVHQGLLVQVPAAAKAKAKKEASS